MMLAISTKSSLRDIRSDHLYLSVIIRVRIFCLGLMMPIMELSFSLLMRQQNEVSKMMCN